MKMLKRTLAGGAGAALMMVAMTLTHPAGGQESGVSIGSAQTNIAQLAPQQSEARAAALEYHVLRDNFKTYNTCESYRKNYVVHYPYHLASYCTRTKQGNGRHWLYVAYESCPDVAPLVRPRYAPA